MNNDAVLSAILNSVVKSLKIQKSLTESADQQMKMLTEIKQTQMANAEAINKLQNFASKEDIGQLAENIMAIVESQETLIKDAKGAETRIMQSVKDTDASANIEIVGKLVKGMQTLHENMVTVSDAMNKLDEHMDRVNTDTQALGKIIAGSNARVEAMSMNMAAFLDLANDNLNTGNVDDALMVLEDMNEDEDDEDDQDQVPKGVGVKMVSRKDARRRDQLRQYVKELDDTVASLEEMNSKEGEDGSNGQQEEAN